MKVNHVLIDTLVAMRDHMPYVRIAVNDERVQLSMADARKIAKEIQEACFRAEADAMIVRFFQARDLPMPAVAALIGDFREFRSAIDRQSAEGYEEDPDSGERKPV